MTNPSAEFLISPLMLIAAISSLSSNYLSRQPEPWTSLIRKNRRQEENILSSLFHCRGRRGMVGPGLSLNPGEGVTQVQNKLFIDRTVAAGCSQHNVKLSDDLLKFP